MIFFVVVFIILVVICYVVYEKRDPITRKKISPSYDFDKTFVEPNELFTLRTKLKNDSTHSMRRLYAYHLLDDAFVVEKAEDYRILPVKTGKDMDRKVVVCRTCLKGKQERELEMQLRLPRRGVYGGHRFSMEYVDGMGFHSSRFEQERTHNIVVAPKKVDDDFLASLIVSGYGDFNAKQGFIEDAMSISTYDEYTGHEPMRQISWKKTAQAGKLMVKKFEPMGAHVTTVVFDVDGLLNAQSGSLNFEYAEYAVSMLRMIFEYFEKNRISYRFYTNAKSSFISNHTYVGIPAGKKSKIQMLTMLGELQYNVFGRERIPSKQLLDVAIKGCSRAPLVYIAPLNRYTINLHIKKLSKRKGIEIIELYANDFYKQKNRDKEHADKT